MLGDVYENQLSDMDLANANGGGKIDSDRTHGMIRVQCSNCGENFWAMRGEPAACPKCDTVIEAF